MPLHLLGINHQTAPVALREQVHFLTDRLRELLPRLKTTHQLSELVYLSTCNRSELYFHGTEFNKAAIEKTLSERVGGIDLSTHVYYHHNTDAIRHLFRVASGLDSMVVGEQEILAQIKQAYLVAKEMQVTGKLMNVLFQRSLFVGKRVRTETGISQGSGSIASIAVNMAERIFGQLTGRTVLVFGAGEMASQTARYLMSQKIERLWIANRTLAHAERLVSELGGEAFPFEEGFKRLSEVDVVICSSGSEEAFITKDRIQQVMQERKGRSIFFIDIAVPCNVSRDVHALDNVYVYNIDDFQTLVQQNLSKRTAEIEKAEKLVQQLSEEFMDWFLSFQQGLPHALKHYGAINKNE